MRLREAEAAMTEGSMLAEASRKIGVTEQTYNRIRPRSSLGSGPPARAVILPAEPSPPLVGLTSMVVQTLRTGQISVAISIRLTQFPRLQIPVLPPLERGHGVVQRAIHT